MEPSDMFVGTDAESPRSRASRMAQVTSYADLLHGKLVDASHETSTMMRLTMGDASMSRDALDINERLIGLIDLVDHVGNDAESARLCIERGDEDGRD